jgi:IclR family transcriptional regulator, KDG regulon repressor
MTDILIKSARRVFDILELFRARRCPLRLKDVVEALNIPTSSAAALLKTMTELNYLCFESGERTYSPTPRLSQLGNWVTLSSYESGPVRETVRRIERKVDETVIVGTATEIYVEIVDVSSGRPGPHVGSRVLLVHSGLGWPLLTELHSKDVARIYRRTLQMEKISRSVTSIDGLRRNIARVRRDGYCLSRGMVTFGVGVIGMLMPTPLNHRRLAIGAVGLQERIQTKSAKILAAMQAENVRLADVLGVRTPEYAALSPAS